MPYSRLSEVLDLTQMFMDIQKQHKTTAFIITHNFCYNNIVKKPSPGMPLGRFPTPSCQRCWTSPRCSWTSRNNFKQLFSSYPITSVSTRFSKDQYLGHPLVLPYSWLLEVLDLTQMVIDIRKKLKQLFSSSPITSVTTRLSKDQYLGHPLVLPYSWLSEVLDLTQMVIDIRKQLKTTVVILPYNF